MKSVTESRSWSFIIIAAIYISAAIIGIITYNALRALGADSLWANLYHALFAADFVATVYVWAWGLVYKNVSVYDPYWSVAPPVLYTALLWETGAINIATILLLVAVWAWGIRLTGNWAYTFKGLKHEDWRYTKYRTECHPVIFQLINFFGLNMMPTIVVFLCMVPGVRIMETAGSISAADIFQSALTAALLILGFIMSISAMIIQLVSDTQAQRFRAQNPGKVCNTGLWKHGRHPNYFGEFLMWWGVWVMYLGTNPVFDFRIAGAIAVTLMFRFISVPLMESRQLKRKPEYAQYKKSTRVFI